MKISKKKKILKEIKERCTDCSRRAKSFYQTKPYCKECYPKKPKEPKYKSREWWNNLNPKLGGKNGKEN